MSKKGRRGAFTLVELLVVIAIIGVLVSLLLPAVQMAREAARRMACSNNLKQFALAAGNFESTTQKLPANRQYVQANPTYAGPNGKVVVGWVYDLLPYIEQQPAYDLLKRDAANVAANTTTMKIMLCSSDNSIQLLQDTSYQVNGGVANNSTISMSPPDFPANGVSDDLVWIMGPTTPQVPPQMVGVYTPVVRASSGNCKDGTSNTISYAENCNAQQWNGSASNWGAISREEYLYCLLWIPCDNTVLAQVFGNPPNSSGMYGINDGGIENFGLAYARPSSQHPGGFQAAFAGSNVRYIRESIDYYVYAQLLSGDGANVLNPNTPSPPYGAPNVGMANNGVRIWQSALLSPQTYE